MFIGTFEQAIEYFIKKYNGMHLDNLYNKSKLYAKIKVNDDLYYVTFKREFFYTFGRIFGKKGIGQSYSEDIVLKASSDNAIIVFIMPDSKIYSINANEVKKYAIQNNTIRKIYNEPQKNYSVPVSLLKRMDL